jgi:hypothetical protein
MGTRWRCGLTFALAALAGCATHSAETPANSSAASAIAGNLYILHGAPGEPHTLADFVLVRDGVQLGDHKLATLLTARRAPKVALGPGFLFAGDCEPIAISQHGRRAACVRQNDLGNLTIFEIGKAGRKPVDTTLTIGGFSTVSAAFLGDGELAVLADDPECPAAGRSPRARLRVIDGTGRLLRSGPCAHGVVAGDKRLALLRHEASGADSYSTDEGASWKAGDPMTFDGEDRLLVLDRSKDAIVDERGRTIAEHALSAFWTSS